MKIKLSKKMRVVTFSSIALLAVMMGLYLERCDKKEFMATEIPEQTQLPNVTYETHYDAEGRLDINMATAEELDRLEGIGEKLVQRIIEYRSGCGGFTAIEELRLVSGIGNSLFENIKDRICVR